jgi:hypothetical protein
LSNSVEKLSIELSNIGLEDIGKLWSNIGTNYIPSVAYKVKHIVYNGNTISENISTIM